ncbi:MAG: DUF1801 domain-containing protein [Acidimicrobiia bacterium]
MADRAKDVPAKNAPVKKAPVLLSGGNPQIAKGDGDGPVQAYIEAAPGWKGDVSARLDALIVASVPGVKKAVKWNTPLYGTDEYGWFASFHCFTNYVKVTFFNGTALEPMPPVPSKTDATRYAHVTDDGVIDEAQMTDWFRQASRIPGWKM